MRISRVAAADSAAELLEFLGHYPTAAFTGRLRLYALGDRRRITLEILKSLVAFVNYLG